MLLTVQDVATALGTAPGAVYRWIEKGGLGGVRASGEYRVHPVDLLNWSVERRVPLAGAVFRFDEDNPVPPRALAEALARGSVLTLDATQGEHRLVEAIAERVAERSGAEPGALRQHLAARRGTRFVSPWDGVAIPAPLWPLLLGVSEPIAHLFYPEPPSALAGLGAEPVRAWFWLVAPTARDHLVLVERLVRLLATPPVADALGRRAPAGEILSVLGAVEPGLAGRNGDPA